MSLTSASLSSLTLFQVIGFLFICVCRSVMSNSLQPHRLWLSRHLCPWNSPGKNTEVGCHFLLQGIFLTWNQTWVSHTAGRFFTIWATREALWISFSLSNWLFLLPSLRLVLIVPIKSSSPVLFQFSSVQFSCSVVSDSLQPHGLQHASLSIPVHHRLPEFTQTHVHWVGDAIQPSHPLSCPSPPALNLSQHQGLFKWVSSSHQVAKVLEFQHRYKLFQWTLKTDPL